MKPQPKAEVVVEIPKTLLGPTGAMVVYAASNSAAEWIEENLPEYGLLEASPKFKRTYALYVCPLYDINEVKAYIEDSFTFDLDSIEEIPFDFL